MLAGLLWTPLSGRAQEAPVQFPTGDASWSVLVQYHSKGTSMSPASAPAPGPPGSPAIAQPGGRSSSPAVRKIDVTATGNLCRSVATYSDGKTAEIWWLKSPQWVLFDRRDSAGVGVLTNPMMMANLRPDAALFDWVNSRSFIKRSSYRGKDCDQYEAEFPPANHPPGVNPPAVPHHAWVESQTGLPIALDDGVALYLFTFNPPPTVPLTMPPRFSQKLAELQDALIKPVYLGNPPDPQ
jgi:hypothetical protein